MRATSRATLPVPTITARPVAGSRGSAAPGTALYQATSSVAEVEPAVPRRQSPAGDAHSHRPRRRRRRSARPARPGSPGSAATSSPTSTFVAMVTADRGRADRRSSHVFGAWMIGGDARFAPACPCSLSITVTPARVRFSTATVAPGSGDNSTPPSFRQCAVLQEHAPLEAFLFRFQCTAGSWWWPTPPYRSTTGVASHRPSSFADADKVVAQLLEFVPALSLKMPMVTLSEKMLYAKSTTKVTAFVTYQFKKSIQKR